ncbi:MAG: hypothetical protein H8E14_04150 [Candidatus Marinimicrobia bacterium]|nr:hypothetical protein [Candidatus Neomarinimicrobiota bacterium]
MKYLQTIISTFVVLVLLFSGCRKIHEASNLELTEYAWDQYEHGNYPESYTSFKEAITIDSTYQDGYNGLGWALGKLVQVDSSVFYFSTGLPLTQPKDVAANVRHEIWAGLTFAHQAAGQDSLAILFGDSLITDISDVIVAETASWTFSHDEDLNHLDVRLSLATANFNRGAFGTCLSHIESIVLEVDTSSTFIADTTTVLGRQAMAAKLEELHDLLAFP